MADSEQFTGARATDPLFVSLASAAIRYGISLRTLRRWIDDGKLPVFKVGHTVRIRLEDLEAFERRRTSARGDRE